MSDGGGLPSFLERIRAYGARARELRALLGLTFVSATIWGVLEIAEEVNEGAAKRFDDAVLLAMRDPNNLNDPIGPKWFEDMVRDFTALAAFGPLTFAVTVIIGYLLLVRRWGTAILILVAEVGGTLLNYVLKLYFERTRPDIVPHATFVRGLSFPSGHSMMAAVTYLTMAALLVSGNAPMRNRLYLLGSAIALTILVGLSRIYLGVHYPTDVIAGWTAGAGWATTFWLLARKLHVR